MKSSFYLACSLFAIGFINLACEAAAQSKPDKIRIGYAARAVAHSVPFVAKEAGFFAEEGMSRKEDTIRILAKFLGTKDREALEESWEYAAKMPAKPYAVESAVQAVLDHLTEAQPRFAQHKPAEFIDARLLAQIDKSGFIDKLYAGQAK